MNTPIVGPTGDEPMEVRFVLDEIFDAGLIDRIKQRANGKSTNQSAKFLFRHWFESEQYQFLPSIRQRTDEYSSDSRQNLGESDDQLPDLSQIDEEW